MLREGHEALGEHTDGVLATARLGAKGSVDAASGGAVARVVFVGGGSGDEVGEGVEPEAAIECALGEQRVIDERTQHLVCRALRTQQGVVFTGQAIEGEVASLPSQAEQRFCNERTFPLLVDVAHDAEQIAGIDAVGK